MGISSLRQRIIGARLAPSTIAMMGCSAVSAMTAVALSLFHPPDATLIILICNSGVAAMLLIAIMRIGRRLISVGRFNGVGQSPMVDGHPQAPVIDFSQGNPRFQSREELRVREAHRSL